MKSSRIFFPLAVLVGLIFSSSVFAAPVLVSGYLFSDSAGWISLSCVDSSSCQDISYGLSLADDGTVTGYGYSQNAGWIHFNPKYGGVKMNAQQQLSGWAWSETVGWVYIDAVKIETLTQLRSQIIALQDSSTGMSGSVSLISIVRQFCFQIYGNGDNRCDAF